MKGLSFGQFPRRMDHVVWRVIEDKGILLNLEDGAYFQVDAVGLAIWKKCDGKTALPQMASSIAREFKTSPRRLTEDLPRFLSEMRRRKLLEISESPRPAVRRN